MSKRPQTYHAKAVSAFVNGWISRREYQLCCAGDAWISGRSIWLPDETTRYGWSVWLFAWRGRVTP